MLGSGIDLLAMKKTLVMVLFACILISGCLDTAKKRPKHIVETQYLGPLPIKLTP